MPLTAAEQYLLELINRARLDPQAEADRYGVNLNSGLSAGTIDGSSKQVLAHNTKLEAAAKSHSDWMLRADVFSHSGARGTSPGDRMEQAGYDFTGSWTWRENLAWTGSTGNVNMARAIEQHHEGLYRSAGHRANTFADDVREIGVAQVSGKFSYQGTTYNTSMLTEKFAKTGAEVFVTGVAYVDRDGDRFYSIGEARKDVWIRVDGQKEDAGSAGGYGVATDAAKKAKVAIGFDKKTMAKLTVDTTDGNAKLDMVKTKSGDWLLELSGSADLERGIRDAKLLGLDDLKLNGSNKGNELRGNTGDNRMVGEGGADRLVGVGGDDRLNGNDGKDVLLGGKGRDTMNGGNGNDVMRGGSAKDMMLGGKGRDLLDGDKGGDTLDGGSGNDTLRGEGGADTFIFRKGEDVILDFQNNKDTIAIDQKLLGADGTTQDALDAVTLRGGDAVFDFGDHVLTVKDVEHLNELPNDLIII